MDFRDQTAFEELIAKGLTPTTKADTIARAFAAAWSHEQHLQLYNAVYGTEYEDRAVDLIVLNLNRRNFGPLCKAYLTSNPGDRLEAEIEKRIADWAWIPTLWARALQIARPGSKLRAEMIARFKGGYIGTIVWKQVCDKLRTALEQPDEEMQEFFSWVAEQLIDRAQHFDDYATAYILTRKNDAVTRRFLLAKMEKSARFTSDRRVLRRYRYAFEKEPREQEQV